MYNKILKDTSFFYLLLKIDKDIASNLKSCGCHCGGVLDSAHYPRKPRGLPDETADDLCVRLSFCCRNEGCRKRSTPPSVRFAGRKVWLAAFVLVLSGSCSKKLTKETMQSIGARPRTIKKWQAWWKTFFDHAPFWKAHSVRLHPKPDPQNLPQALLDFFVDHHDTTESALVACLQFLSTGFCFVQDN